MAAPAQGYNRSLFDFRAVGVKFPVRTDIVKPAARAAPQEFFAVKRIKCIPIAGVIGAERT